MFWNNKSIMYIAYANVKVIWTDTDEYWYLNWYWINRLFGGVSIAHLLNICLCCPVMCFNVLSSVLWCPLWFPNINYVRFLLNLQLVVGGLMSYLRYLWLPVNSGVQCMLCCVFALFFFVLCTLCCQLFWIIHFWLPLRYFLLSI